MFPVNICQNIDILVVINVWKNDFGFHSNKKTQGHKHQLNNLYLKYQVCKMRLRHLNTFLQFRRLFHEPHCRQIVRSIFVEFFVLNGSFTKIGIHLFLTFETQKRKWWFENRTSTSYKGNRFLPFVFIAALLIYKSLHVRYFTVIRFSWDAWFYS